MTIVLVLILIIGLSLLLYPTVANLWNSKHASRTINTYTHDVEELTDDAAQKMWLDAVEYNKRLAEKGNEFYPDDAQMEEYESLLNIGGSGVMGYVVIDKIDVKLPIYHGVSDGVLQIAAGHLEWSSLPVGGEGSHCVLSGHRGLPSAKLFTDIASLVVGDQFQLVVLDTVLTYEVDQIRTVEPTELQNLTVTPGKDYCTLGTCTPYGINTHRLLVRGHRIETKANDVRVVSEAVVIDPMIVAPLAAIPLLVILLIIVLTKKSKKKQKTSLNSKK
ncbi:MAG: class C sortase [Lachnospiraceae bacterium]|nr:class C sortase [Lachnospiraceae bacterium]